MSRTIDERVVEMKFDNKQFETNVRTSMSTLEKLKKSLDMDGATKGFENVDRAARKVNLEGLGTAVENVKLKFSALEVVAITALTNLTNSAISTGKRLIASLSVDQITAGWDKYNQKTASVQTIMNATGKSIDEVNGYLDKLMWFSDETSYGFTDMTSALAQLTSSGGDIDKLIPMITGIANATAFAGKGANEFSRAIYNLNQSYSAGSLQYMDWKSIEQAGVASEQLKQIFIDTGVELGKIKKDEVTIANFGTTLKDKWADTSVMEAAFGKFGEMTEKAYQMIQNGEVETASEAYAILAETYEGVGIKAAKAAQEAKTFGEAIDATKDAVSSGWMRTFDIIFGNYEEAKVLWTDLANAMYEVFAAGAEDRNAMLEEWKELGGRTLLVEAFWTAWENVGDILGTVKEAFREVFPKMTSEQLYKVTENLKKLVDNLKLSETASANLKSTFKGLFAVLDIVKRSLLSAFSTIKPLIGGIGSLGEAILTVTGTIGNIIVKFNEFTKTSSILREGAEGITIVFATLLNIVLKLISHIGNAATGMESAVTSVFNVMEDNLAGCRLLNWLDRIWTMIKSITQGVAKVVSDLIGELTNSLSSLDFSGIINLISTISFGGIAIGINKILKNIGEPIEGLKGNLDGVTKILDSVRDCFEAYQQRLQSDTLLKIAGAIALLTAAIAVISSIDSDKLGASLGAITVVFGELMGSMAIFNKIGGGVSGVAKSVIAMLGIATAVLILSSALKKIGELDWGKLAKGLTGVAGLTIIIVASAKIMSIGGKTIVKCAAQMLIFAAAIKILASVCEEMSKLDWVQIAKGLVGVGALLTEVSLFMRTVKFSGKSIGTAVGIMIMSAAIKVLASACEDFGKMKWEDIGKSLAMIAAFLGEITVFTKLTSDTKHIVSTSMALIVISAALRVFAGVLNQLGTMSWEKIAKGLITLGSTMTILAIGLKAMTGTLAGSAALLVAANALFILAPTLFMLGAMSWSSIAKGLISLAGAFAVIGVAGLLLTPLVPAILGLSGAIALVGVAVLGIGFGISALAVGLTTLAAAGTAGATAIVASLTLIVTGITGLIPTIAANIGRAVVEFCKVIADSVDAIGGAVKTVILALVDIFVECIPAIVDGAFKLLSGVLNALVEYTPAIVDSIFQFLISILEGVAKNLPGLIKAAVNILISFFSGIVDAIKGIDTRVLLQGVAGIGVLATIMGALNAVTVLIPGAMLGVIGIGAVIAELALVLAAVGLLAQIPGLNWLINEGGNLLQGIGTTIGKFIGGIVGGFMSGVSSQFPQIGSNLSGFMTNIQPFLDGATSINPSMLDGVKALAETILILTAANILDGLTSWFTGGSSLSRFAEEMIPFGKAIKLFSEEISGIDGDTVSRAAIAGKTLAEMAAALPNSGGIVGLFAGENDMSTFAEQLVPFGTAMKEFADEVSGIDSGAISDAAIAGKALAEMATTVPNSGGVIGFFAGENDMDEFGDQLVSFGTAMKNYSLAVDGLDASVITNSTNIAKALVELSNNLPNGGGVFSLFTGENNIATFGEQLASFGSSFAEFYTSVSTIETTKLTGIVGEIDRLVDIANSIGDAESGAMSSFAKGLKELGKAGIDGLIGSFSNAGTQISTAIDLLVGIIGSKSEKFVSAGKTMMDKLVSGLKSGTQQTRSAVAFIVSECLATVNSKTSAFYSAGMNVAAEFANGISANTYLAVAKASAMAAAAAAAARSELDIHSPSGVSYGIGNFFGLGFVNALTDYTSRSYTAGESVGTAARDGLRAAISKVGEFVENGIDSQPTIRPVLDLSNVSSGVGKLSAMMSRTQAMKISAGMQSENTGVIQNGSEKSAVANNYNFTQNNYSPKSLSRIDIYRQTKNQFAALKGLVEA